MVLVSAMSVFLLEGKVENVTRQDRKPAIGRVK